ncbi:hypothetical protein ACL7TT_05175 [Microbulbifer sp. 2304DJ12-6]|uniref:hypothetical protein n=1 Tax=Microbulbifer sp. 2304DJ12-6 TaxID=3233340 RepID=UPI0039AEB776
MQKMFFTWEPENNNSELLEEWIGNRFGVSPPEDFLMFIRSNGIGVSPIPNQFSGKIGMDQLIIEEFYQVFPPEKSSSIQTQTSRAIDNERISDDMIVFAYGAGSHLKFVLVVKGVNSGNVFAYMDGGVHIDDNQIRLSGDAVRLAFSFSNFINGLYADEDSLEEWEDTMGYLPDEIKEKFGSGS